MLRNGDTLASESIEDFQQAVCATEDQIAKDEARLSVLVSHAQATADQVATVRTLCQEAVLRIDALESEAARLSSGISLRRAEIDQTAAAAGAVRAPRHQCEAEAAAQTRTSCASRATYISQGTATQAEVARMISVSNPCALQAQIEAQKLQINTLRAHVDLCRASVSKLRGVVAPPPAAALLVAPDITSDSSVADRSNCRLQVELAACRESVAAAKANHNEDAGTFHRLRDELRQATKRLCCEAEASEERYHAARREYDSLNDAAAAKHCSMCQRPLSS
jgi:hypothetical protein